MKTLELTLLVCLFVVQSATANLVTKGVREITEAILKKGGKEATPELIEFGGKQAIQEVLEKAAKEGGDELVEKVTQYGTRYGLAALKTINNAPSLYVKALDDLPETLVERALWAAQREQVTITRLLDQHGSDALLIAAKHRGVGTDIVAKLGDDGIHMARNLNENQAVVLARHADEIADLPSPQKRQVVDAILSAPDRTINYMETHPKVFMTATGITTLVALKSEVVGKPETEVLNPDGLKSEEVTPNPDGSKSKQNKEFPDREPGISGKLIPSILIIIAFIVGGWVVGKIRGIHRQKKIKASCEKFHVNQEEKEDPGEKYQPTEEQPSDPNEASAQCKEDSTNADISNTQEEGAATSPSPSLESSTETEEYFPLTEDEIRKKVFMDAFILLAKESLQREEPPKWKRLVDETVRKLLEEGLIKDELSIYRKIAKGEKPDYDDYQTPRRYINKKLKEWFKRQLAYEDRNRREPRPTSLYI